MTEPGDIWWSELYAHDLDKAAQFYAKVAGWQPVKRALGDMSRTPEPDEPAYMLFMKDGEPVCGGMSMSEMDMPEGIPAHWFTHVAVADVDAACKAVKAAGGKVVKEPWDIPGVGRIAIIQDVEGAHVGLGTPESMKKGAAA